MSEDCKRAGRIFGGCHFAPRYDLGPADVSRFTSLSGAGAGSFLEKLRKQTYVRDVCVRCGKTIERHVDNPDPT